MAIQIAQPIRLLTFLSDVENVRVFQWVLDLQNYHSVALSDLDYLLEIDTDTSFASVNYRSFTLSSNIQKQIGNFVIGFEVPMPPRQPIDTPTYYWRVRIQSTNYYSNSVLGTSFVLDQNQTNSIFETVFEGIPDNNVYPKDTGSTNVAVIEKAYAKELDAVNYELERTKRSFVWSQCRDSELYGIVGALYDIPPNPDLQFVEYRDLLLQVSKIFEKTTTVQSIIDIVKLFTGVEPVIIEYVTHTFWRLDDNPGIDASSLTNTYFADGLTHYFIQDPSYPELNPIVIEDSREKAFTWELHISNPFAVNYSITLLKQLIYEAMPAHTKVYFVFDDPYWGVGYWGTGWWSMGELFL